MPIILDNIPDNIRYSKILTGDDLEKLSMIETIPSEIEVLSYRNNQKIKEFYEQALNGCVYLDNLLHVEAQRLLHENKILDAWLTLLQK